MDPFEVRMTFISLLNKLTSSLPSIQRVSAFALKHGPKCGDDIWDCLVDECNQVNLNARINLLYFLDTLLDKHAPGQPYKDLVRRDLAKLVEMVVPQTKEGVLNLMSASQVLRSWKTRRLLDADLLDSIIAVLEGRRASLHSAEPGTSSFSKFSRNDILRRIEDDRERHKRLRERIWVLPVPATLFATTVSTISNAPSRVSIPSGFPNTPSSPESSSADASFLLPTKLKAKKHHAHPPPPPSPVPLPPSTSAAGGAAVVPSANAPLRGPEAAIEIEFDQLWEASEEEMARSGAKWSSRRGFGGGKRGRDEGEQREVGWELSEEDRAAMARERKRCFVSSE